MAPFKFPRITEALLANSETKDNVAGLRKYQLEGVEFLKKRPAALLADEMGLGKTVQAAVALRLLIMERAINRSLIVVPNSLKLNWNLEIKKWAPELSVRILAGSFEDRVASYELPIQALVASYDQVRIDADFLLPHKRFDLVLLDEAQWIKNSSSKIAWACRAIPRDWSWAMTGTPLENAQSDLISISRFFAPGLLHGGMPKFEIHEALQPVFLRRHKEDVFDELPEVIDQELHLELSDAQKQRYNEIQNEFRSNRHGGGNTLHSEVFAVITKLKQICNFDPESQESSKLEALEDIVDNVVFARGKLLVFSQYVETLQWLYSRLILKGVRQNIFYGGLSEQAKHSLVTEFNDLQGPQILYVSLRAGGVGLNLGEADCVVLFDRWWNPAVESQAIARAIRFVRTKVLHVFRFLVDETIEERIAELLLEKRELFDEYIEQAEVADVGGFTRNDLLRILGVET